VRVLDIGALAEQRVGLVVHASRTAVLPYCEYPLEVLVGLADVLAYRLQQVDAVEIGSERARERARGHRLTSATLTREQRAHALLMVLVSSHFTKYASSRLSPHTAP
jgi:hypothetical protein